ncbi:hypothetical protein TYRP_014907, partial [Tyrophagus putrescentiae]
FTHAADDQAAAEGEVDHKKIVESLRGQILAKSPAEVKPETNPEIVFKSVQSLPTPVNVLGATHHYVYELAIGGKDATVNVDQIGPSNTVNHVEGSASNSKSNARSRTPQLYLPLISPTETRYLVRRRRSPYPLIGIRRLSLRQNGQLDYGDLVDGYNGNWQSTIGHRHMQPPMPYDIY